LRVVIYIPIEYNEFVAGIGFALLILLRLNVVSKEQRVALLLMRLHRKGACHLFRPPVG
jgi:hypothetical protein